MRKPTPLVALLAVTALVFGPAASDTETDTEIVPTFRTERTYLHCQDDVVKLNNVQALQESWVSWDTTPPNDSVQDGAGCGHLEHGFSNSDRQNPLDFVIEGRFTGNLETLTVHLHDMGPAVHALTTTGAPLPYNIFASLYIDGVLVHEGTTGHIVTPTSENSGATYSTEISFTNIGLGLEHGDGVIERDYVIALRTSIQTNWVYDTTEVPAGVTFNPPTPAEVQIPV